MDTHTNIHLWLLLHSSAAVSKGRKGVGGVPECPPLRSDPTGVQPKKKRGAIEKKKKERNPLEQNGRLIHDQLLLNY